MLSIEKVKDVKMYMNSYTISKFIKSIFFKSNLIRDRTIKEESFELKKIFELVNKEIQKANLNIAKIWICSLAIESYDHFIDLID